MGFLSLLFASLFTHAYLLEYSTIMSRTSDNHGNGGYQVQQTIQWNIDGAPAEVLETWTVINESKMHLRVEGLGRLRNQVQGEIVYDTQKKTFKSADGQITSSKLPATFSPHFYHYRSSRWMRERMVSLKMAPPQSLQNRPPLSATDKQNYVPQDFISLQRIGGTITYGIGDKTNPSLFIEQDQFVITRVRFSPEITVTSGEYASYPGSFHYPKSLDYKWNNRTATAKVRKVTYLGRSPKNESVQFSNAAPPLTIPDENVIRDFYSMFR